MSKQMKVFVITSKNVSSNYIKSSSEIIAGIFGNLQSAEKAHKELLNPHQWRVEEMEIQCLSK